MTGHPPRRRARPAIIAAAAVLTGVSIAAKTTGHTQMTFVASALAIVPLAAIIGRATEELATRAGPRVGGLVNATLGNIAEIMIGLLLVLQGQVEVVRASLTGSVLSNLLLVLGASFLVAGARTKQVEFSSRAASAVVASMALAVAGMLLPSIYARHAEFATDFRREVVSVGVAGVLAALYLSTLAYTLITHRDALRRVETQPRSRPASWSLGAAVGVLVVAAAVVAVESELLVDALEPTLHSWHVSDTWAGLVLISIVGNAAEHSSAVMMAWRDRIDVAIDISVGSSAQVALLVTPLLVFAGAVSGHHLQLTFTTFELGALSIGVAVAALLTLDGEADWLEGAQLIAVYAVVAISAFFVGKP